MPGGHARASRLRRRQLTLDGSCAAQCRLGADTLLFLLDDLLRTLMQFIVALRSTPLDSGRRLLYAFLLLLLLLFLVLLLRLLDAILEELGLILYAHKTEFLSPLELTFDHLKLVHGEGLLINHFSFITVIC